MKIAIIGPSFNAYRLRAPQIERVCRAMGSDTLLEFDDPIAFRAALCDVDIAAGHVGLAPLPALGRLRWFHTWAAGIDHEPAEALLAAGVRVTCSKGNGAIPIAEFTLMAMLMIARQATDWIDAQRHHEWRRHTSPELAGATLGLIGLGHIGTEIARRASAFGMKCLAVRRHAAKVPADVPIERTFGPDGLTKMLAQADFVVVAAALTPETKGMLGEAEFHAMKPSAFYICVSRGAIADPAALHKALTERWIAGAVLDAHAVEPLPPDSPSWDLPNTLVTPHNAGTTLGTADRAVDIFIENLDRFRNDQALRNEIEPGVGY